MNVHRLLRIKPMEDFKHMNKSEWFGFLLFNILDHICTTSFVFANILEIYSKTFANSQRYRKMIARSILGSEIPPTVSNAFPLTI
jgi:methyltransferase-like protein